MIIENIQSTVVPKMDYEKYRMVSYTQLSLWLECPHKWKLMYIDKLKQPPNIHLAFGSAMHESLQEYFELMYNKSIKQADAFDIHEDFQQRFMKMYKDYKEQIGENFSTKKEIMEFVNDGLNIIDFFLQRRQMYFSKRGTRLLGIEMPILTPPHKEQHAMRKEQQHITRISLTNNKNAITRHISTHTTSLQTQQSTQHTIQRSEHTTQ